MILAFDRLPKTTLAKKANYFKSEGEMIAENDSVVALIVIETIVTSLSRLPLNFIDTRYSNEVHSLVLK